MAKYSEIDEFEKAYELCDEVGQGSFGTVIRCVSKSDGAEYAVKVIRESREMNIEAIELEIFICQQLEHRNIVRLVEAIKEKNTYFLVFDMMTGGDLFDDIASRKTYTEFDACHCIEQVFKGVAYIHSKNIIHGDLKDKNVLLTDKDKNAIVKIADFGSAVLNYDGEENFENRGTLCFIAPEVFISKHCGKPIDMWACGILLYIMLFGGLPFQLGINLLDDIKRGIYSFPDGADSDAICDEAKDLIRNLLNVDQDSRYTAADALSHPFIRERTKVTSRFHRAMTLESIKVFNVKKRRFHSERIPRTGLVKFRPTPKSQSDGAIVERTIDPGAVKTDFSSESSQTADAKQTSAIVATASEQGEDELGDTAPSNRGEEKACEPSGVGK